MNLTKKFFQRSAIYFPFIACILLLTFNPPWQEFLWWNIGVQLLIFMCFACIPAFITYRMSYVDIAWPWGLVAIGILVLLLGDGYWPRKILIAGMYLLSGLRMGVGALILWKKGHLDKELPRYQFQRKRWKKAGYSNDAFSIQFEILIQCLANMSFLSLPALMLFQNATTKFSILEVIGFIMYVLFVGLEHLADMQKQKFLLQARSNSLKRQVCRVGLWQYSRHPNYFFEWMVWNAMIFLTLPSFIQYFSIQNSVLWWAMGVALMYTSRLMYNTLVYYTGAIPSEYYSVLKRSGYKDYQKQTAMFFPSLPKE
jgi:steroid 5-alpha reductase family enzyme